MSASIGFTCVHCTQDLNLNLDLDLNLNLKLNLVQSSLEIALMPLELTAHPTRQPLCLESKVYWLSCKRSESFASSFPCWSQTALPVNRCSV